MDTAWEFKTRKMNKIDWKSSTADIQWLTVSVTVFFNVTKTNRQTNKTLPN